MKKYRIVFTEYYDFEVEAENEDEAYEIGYDMYGTVKRCPIANLCYDEVEVECLDEEDD